MWETLPPLKEIIANYQLSADKSLGQHFLLDRNFLKKIIRAAPNLNGQNVLEIGPGPGGLTRTILEENPASLIAIEKDRRCIKALQETLLPAANSALVLHSADALKCDYTNLCPPKTHIVANLPYNIGTALLIKWLQTPTYFSSITVMLQKEVAERIVAQPKQNSYGRLAIFCQWLCDVELCFDVPARLFVPPPRVTSAVIKLTPLEKPRYEAKREILEKLTQTVFSARRKMLRSSLKSLCLDPEKLLLQCNIDPQARPETISLEAFCLLARNLDRAA
jgi:16S rRNA (adenine1518-N6/adenine1519-N6)-dimethyltransferase